MSAQDVFDFENILPKAVKAVFVGAGLSALTAQDPVVEHKQRPRVEIFFTGCAEAVPPRGAIQPDGTILNGAWRGELTLIAITDVNTEGKLVMSAYRSQVRALAQTLGPINGKGGAINGTTAGLNNHKVQRCYETGSSHEINTDKGYELIKLHYAVEFSIRTSAWAYLADQAVNLVPAGAVFDAVRNDYGLSLVVGHTYIWVKGTNEASRATNGLTLIQNPGTTGTQVAFVAGYQAIIFSGPASQTVDLELVAKAGN